MVYSNFSNDTTEKDSNEYLYQNLCRYYLVWYLPVVVTIGTLGAAFCMVFLFLSRLFPKNILIWMVSICIGDFMILILDALRLLIKLWFDYDVRDANGFLCKSHNYFSNFFFYWSAYMQTCMSIQRLYFVLQPLKARVHFTFSRVSIIWGVVTFLCLFPLSPYMLFWQVQDNSDCEPNDKWYYYVTSVSDMVIWGIIPLVTMTISTTLISVRVFNFKTAAQGAPNNNSQSNSQSEKEALKQNATETDDITPIAPTVTVRNPKEAVGRRHGGSDNARNVTRLLVCMNLFYMTTTYPLLIYEMYLNFGLKNQVGITISKNLHKFLYYLMRSFCYLNSSCNWLFYCAAGTVFRQRAAGIICSLFSGRCPHLRESHYEMSRRYNRNSSLYYNNRARGWSRSTHKESLRRSNL